MINEMFLAGLGTGTTLGGVIGVLAGRKLEWHNAYGAGRVTQKMMDDYDPGSTALGRLAQAHGHGIDQPCTNDCYSGKR
jgi:hypothetical protein